MHLNGSVRTLLNLHIKKVVILPRRIADILLFYMCMWIDLMIQFGSLFPFLQRVVKLLEEYMETNGISLKN